MSLRTYLGLFMALLCVLAPTADAQTNYKLSAPNTSSLPGGTLAADILMTNQPEPAQGFQFGLSFDPTLLTLNLVTQGADLQSLDGGQGADYFFHTEPNGSGGVTVGCLLYTSPSPRDRG